MKNLRLALMVGLLAAACGDDGGDKENLGGDGDKAPNEPAGDGDETGGDGDEPGDPGEMDTGAGLVINAAFGLEVIDRPPDGDSNLKGLVALVREGGELVSAAVTLNGVELVEDPVLRGSFGAPTGFQFEDIGPDKSLRISAKDAQGERSVELPCPPDVQLTAPKKGDTVHSGDKLTVTWSGDAHANKSDIQKPSVQFHEPNVFNGKWAPIYNASTIIETGQTSVEVTIPQIAGDGERVIALQLHVPGIFINTAAGMATGACWLVRRLELNVAP